jgi:hypothetical protein
MKRLAGYAVFGATLLALVPLAALFAIGALLAGRGEARHWRDTRRR